MDCNEKGMFYDVETPLTGEDFKSGGDPYFSNASGFLGIFRSKEERAAKKLERQTRKGKVPAGTTSSLSIANSRAAQEFGRTQFNPLEPETDSGGSTGIGLSLRSPSVKGFLQTPQLKNMNLPKPGDFEKRMGGFNFDKILGTAVVAAGTAAEVAQAGQQQPTQAGMGMGTDMMMPREEDEKKDNTIFWIIGGGLVAVAAVVMLVARQSATNTKK
jgi:hypothetical protein